MIYHFTHFSSHFADTRNKWILLDNKFLQILIKNISSFAKLDFAKN